MRIKGSAGARRTLVAMRSGLGIRRCRLAAVSALAVLIACLLSSAPCFPDAQAAVARPKALGSFWITYYWFAPESWFEAKRIVPLGLAKAYREDFLYGAKGIAMQGTGTGDDGVLLHWRSGSGAWINKDGVPTTTSAGGFTNGSPYARPGGCTYWTVGADGKPGSDTRRPTFPLGDETWSNPPAAPVVGLPVCDKAAATAKAAYPDGHDWTRRGYLDTYGVGVGTAVTPWHSIATDRDWIPRGTAIYIEALKDTPSRGCFVAEDTGGAIIDKHIDILIPPDKTLSQKFKLPSRADLTQLPTGVECPPPTALAPGPLGVLDLSYLIPAAEATFGAAKSPAKGLDAVRLREDFLYGTDGVVARSLGTTARHRMVVALGGGWWVDATGRKTMRKSDGTWTRGAPVWRDGGWRTRAGRPTFKRADGTWARGKGVHYLRYRDRFRFGSEGEHIPWRTIAAAKSTAPLGTLLSLDGVPAATCLVVNRLVATLPTNSIQIVVPAGTDPASLPALSPANVLSATAGTADGCPA